MTYAAWYVTMTLYWHPIPAVALETGPSLTVYRGEARAAQVYPLTLTWTPDVGFGLQTEVTLEPR